MQIAGTRGTACPGTSLTPGLTDRSGDRASRRRHSPRAPGPPAIAFGDEAADALGGLDEMAVGQMCVAGGRAVATVPEQLADLGQVLAADDGLAGHGVS